ncbi:MAG: hypothetical protein SFX18_16120 [Pirellulales bacterium]|nr:hypothetical protein [Pirellulales bacterium]
MSDTIIQEIRNTRDEAARRFNYDLHAMCNELRREQELSGARIVSFSAKQSQPAFAEQGDEPELPCAVLHPES